MQSMREKEAETETNSPTAQRETTLPGRSVLVFPRPSAEDAFRSSQPVDIDLETLRSKFGMRLADAAKTLGISITSLKQVCRKLGVVRWPRRLRSCTTRAGSKGSTPSNDSDNEGAPSGGSSQSTCGPGVSPRTPWSASALGPASVDQKRSADDNPSYIAALSLSRPNSSKMPRHGVHRMGAPQMRNGTHNLADVDQLPIPFRPWHTMHWNLDATAEVSAATTEVANACWGHTGRGGAHALVSNFGTLPAQSPFNHGWTSSATTPPQHAKHIMSVEWPKIVVQGSTNNVGLQQAAPFIQPDQYSPALTRSDVTNETVSAKILATQRELASLMALQTLQNDTAYPTLQSLLQ